MVPVLVAAYLDEIGWGLAMALGALCLSLADNAGPLHHRRNGMLATLGFVVMAICCMDVALPYPWLVLGILAIFSFFFSWIGVFGNRASNVGTSVLIAVTLQLGQSDLDVTTNVMITAAGGLWYFGLSMLLYRIRPYKLAQQLIGECMVQTADYLSAKSDLYHPETQQTETVDLLLKLQAEVHQKQQLVREVLFKTRSIVKESTHTGRVLVMAFLEIVDIFELSLTSETEHARLHQKLGHTTLLPAIGSYIKSLAQYISDAGLAMQDNTTLPVNTSLRDALRRLQEQYIHTRKQYVHAANLIAFNELEHVLESLPMLLDKADMLALYTSYDRKLQLKKQVDYTRFVVPSYINFRLLFANIGFGSNIFRYSIRMAFAVSVGYGISLFFPLEHSYWILLTIVVVVKPAYALTRQRNIHRLLGTLTGGILAVGILYLFGNNKTLLLLITVLSMVGAFSLIRNRYLMAVTLLTMYVLISLFLLKTGAYELLFKDRLLDTFIGGMIGLLFTRIIPPIWERTQLATLLQITIQANRSYFTYLFGAFQGKKLQVSQYKWFRKETYVALANLSDAFQRMLNEPKNRQETGEFLHPLIVACNVLAARLAGVSSLAQQKGLVLNPNNADSWLQEIETRFINLLAIVEGKESDAKKSEIKTKIIAGMEWMEDVADEKRQKSRDLLVQHCTAIASLLTEMTQMAVSQFGKGQKSLGLPGDKVL